VVDAAAAPTPTPTGVGAEPATVAEPAAAVPDAVAAVRPPRGVAKAAPAAVTPPAPAVSEASAAAAAEGSATAEPAPEAAAEAPRRSRARRAVRAVLTPLPEPDGADAGSVEAPTPAAQDASAAQDTPAAQDASAAQDTPAAQDVPAAAGTPTVGEAPAEAPAPARRRGRSPRRAASTAAEPAATPAVESAPAAAGEAPSGAPQAAEPVAEVPADPAATATAETPATAQTPGATEPAAAPARTRRRATSRRARAAEEAATEATPDEQADQVEPAAAPAAAAVAPGAASATATSATATSATATAETATFGTPPVEAPDAEAAAPTGTGGSSAAPRWNAGSTFSAGMDRQASTPRVARRPVTAVTFQAPDLAVHEAPAAPRGRDRDREWTRDRGRDAEQRTDRAEPEPGTSPAEEAPAIIADVAVLEPEETQDVEAGAAEAGLDDADSDADSDAANTRRRRRGRRGRGRARGDEDGLDGAESAGGEADDQAAQDADEDEADERGTTAGADEDEDDDDDRAGSRRRRRRRRRAAGSDEATAPDDPPNTVVHVRETRRDDDLVRGVSGSTRLEAKRQRRREGRDVGRRRPPIVTEAEFLARRESVERRMLVRNAGDRTQIAVLEDGVLVEHFVTRASSASYAGNVYLGRVQNVLASMEAAFVDIGKGRNAVLYAGEVNYDASGLEGRPRKIEQVLKPGQPVLVQVSKDPIGHKGARLTSQISLPGRYLVYVPDGQSAGISRKLPDTERSRLKSILKKITPEDGGVIVRTAAEGASEQELERDIERLAAQWEDIARKAQKAGAPSLLYGEPDLVVRVIRDIFNEDFTELIVQGAGEAETIESYVDMVAPDLRPRVRRHVGTVDLFAEYRVDEQLAKALDRKVWLPSGGSLVIDRTEAMTVVDVNTGKFTGKGGNLEETVTKNNLEAAEEIVRQLRLRDIGGIIVIDFIDMVLESNRELVLRRLTECLGRDRTRHQVAEVTSLGLVQMTRKRVGQGLLEAYSESCPHCHGRGLIINLDGHHAPVAPTPIPAPLRRGGRRGAAATPGGGEQPGLADGEQAAVLDPADGQSDGQVTQGSGDGTAETAAEAGGGREPGRRSRRARRATTQIIAADVPPAPQPTTTEGVAASVGGTVPGAQQAATSGTTTAGTTTAGTATAGTVEAGTGWPDAAAGVDSGDHPPRSADGEPAGLGWPVNGAADRSQHNGGSSADAAAAEPNGATSTGPTVFANSADPDSISGDAAGGRGRRPRRASRPVAKPAEPVEATVSAE